MTETTCMWGRSSNSRCHARATWYVPWKGDRFYYCDEHVAEVEKLAARFDPDTKFIKEAV